jgi:hypothetical protein
VRPLTLIRLATAGSRTDHLRVVFTALSSALAAVILLAAATVLAIPELGTSAEGSDAWNDYRSDLLAQPGLRPGVVATLLLVALPVLALAGQSVRFGTPARDRRLAAVRLAGATPKQAVLIAAGETAMSALIGSLAGLGVYFLLRSILGGRAPDGRLSLPTDVLPPVLSIVLILLAVPVFAALAAALLLRKVIITPLGVVRRVRERKPSVIPGVLIIAGIFAPFVIKPLGLWIFRRFGHLAIAPGWFLVGIGLVVLAAIFGVVLGTGWITYTTGRLLHRFGHRPGMLLAGRRLMADPWSGSRTLAALLAALVVGAGVYGYRQSMLTQFAAEDAVARLLGDDPGRDTGFYVGTIGLVNLTVDLAMAVAAAGILVALAEGIVMRRRTYAALVATGVPRPVLGEALAWQAVTPLIPATLAALAVGIGLARAPGTTAESTTTTCMADVCTPRSPGWHTVTVKLNVPIPFADLALLGAGAVVLMALVVAVGLLFLRLSTDLDELRVG